MGGGLKIPTDYSSNLHGDLLENMDVELHGDLLENIGVDLHGDLLNNIGVNIDGGVTATMDGGLTTTLAGGIATDNVLTLRGDPAAPLSTDSKIEIMNLPRFTLQDVKDMMSVRVRMPNYSNVCLKVLGVELMSVSMGGESQVITQPYVPNAAENCEVDCCEPDTRPFPVRK
ncbi:MAG: hypothetical protein GQ574_17880 [Crocinitomix sp.]|nr:hypothetical protein [Crocinitomix sp.]